MTFDEIETARRTRGRSVLLFLTDRCPVGCAHCSVDSRRDSPTITDFELFEEIVEGICSLPEVEIVGISGGEPFVERRGLVHASRRIVESGKDLVVYTSGVWAAGTRTPGWIREVIRLSNCVFLSTDAFHAEQMQDERFVRAARAIADEEKWIVVQVLELPAMVAQAERLLAAAFGSRVDEFAEIHLIPPLPYGRGAGVFMQTKHQPGHTFGRCGVAAAPVIRYDGLISGCCNENVIMGAGPKRLRRRPRSKAELLDSIESLYSDPLLRAIEGVGPGPITLHPRFADLADRNFSSICEICWEMFERTDGDESQDPIIQSLGTVVRSGP